MKKIFVIVLCLTLIGSFLLLGIGCTQTAAVEPPAADETQAETAADDVPPAETQAEAAGVSAPENETTIDFWFQEWTGGQSWMEAWVQTFEDKYPTIKVNLILLPFEELNTKIFPSIAAGNEADVMMLYDEWLLGKDPSLIFGAITPDLYTKQELAQITFEPALARVTGSDGEIYAAPLGTGANAAGILIHKDLFDEAGIDPESLKDWDDVKEAAEKLTVHNADGSIARSGILFTYTEAANLFLDMICEQGAKDKLLNPETGEWNFNIPEAKNAMETIQWFVDEKIFDPQSGDPFTSFPNKLGAMMVIGPWSLGAWGDQYPDLELDYISMPNYPGTTSNTHAVVSWFNFAVSKRLEGDKKDAALIFIKEAYENTEFFNIPISNGFWVGVPGSQTYVNSVMELVEAGNAPNRASEIAAIVTSNYANSIDLLPTLVSEPELIRTIIYPEMQNVFLGAKTIDQVLDYLTTTLTQKEKENM